MSRFLRDYQLIVRLSETESIDINPKDNLVEPLRITFEGEKSATSQGLNKLNISIYNLKKETRDRIFKDKENRIDYFQVILLVGYKNTQKDTVFKGDIFQAFTEKKDNDYITNIICDSGGFDYKNSFTSKTLTKQDDVVDQLLKDMPNTQKGLITTTGDQIPRMKVLFGSTVELINQEAGVNANWFIDDEKLYILKDDELISDVAVNLNSNTGLLGVPTRANTLVEAVTLINPSIRLRGLVNLLSSEAKNLNGLYTVDTIKFSGDTRGESWYQTLILRESKDFKVLK